MSKKNIINLNNYDKPRRAVDHGMRMFINDERLQVLNMFPSMRVTKVQSYSQWKEEQDEAKFRDMLLALSNEN